MRFVGDEPHLLVWKPDHRAWRGAGAGALGRWLRDGEGELWGWGDVAALGDGVVVEWRGIVGSMGSPDSAEDAAGLGFDAVLEGATSSAA